MRKYVLVALGLFLLFPLVVMADDDLELDCPSISAANQTISCSLIQNNNNIRGLRLNFDVDSEIVYQDVSVSDDYTSYYTKKDGMVITNYGKSDVREVASITFHISALALVNESYDITLSDIWVSDYSHELVSLEDITASVKIVSNDTSLASLSITNGTLSPKFSSSNTSYTATVNASTTTISAVSSNSTATISGSIGVQKLNYGANDFNVVVTSLLGNKTVYNISIVRPLPSVSDDTSSSDKDNSSGSSSATGGSSGTSSDNSSSNVDSGSEEDEVLSSDASLKNIIVEGYDIDFEIDKYIYELTVSNEVTSLEISAILNDDRANVEISQSSSLKVGLNTITIVVTAEDGTVCKYLIKVTREEEMVTSLEEDDTLDNSQLFLNNYVLIAIILVVIIITFIVTRIVKKKSSEGVMDDGG